jgi:LPS O-antigen subunit length determinant protein (WzzB/FepE family)
MADIQTPLPYEEDEIDIKELFNTVKKSKRFLMLFTFSVTVIVLIIALSMPNVYQSKSVLMPQEQDTNKMAGLAGLAGLAGVDMGSQMGNELSAKSSYEMVLNDYDFMRNFIIKYELFDYANRDNFVFTFDFRALYNLFHPEEALYSTLNAIEKEERIYDQIQLFRKIIIIDEDSDTGTITLAMQHANRVYAKEIIDYFISYSSQFLRKQDTLNLNKQLDFYEKKLAKTNDITLKTQIAGLMSGLIQEQVFSESTDYFKVRLLLPPKVAYIKDKLSPKRSLIIVAGFITALILGIFIIFFREFIKEEKTLEEESVE